MNEFSRHGRSSWSDAEGKIRSEKKYICPKKLKAITSHMHLHKPSRMTNGSNSTTAINRKMDGHNRKRKDVIYFYYRRTALDKFVSCVGESGHVQHQAPRITKHHLVLGCTVHTNINVRRTGGCGRDRNEHHQKKTKQNRTSKYGKTERRSLCWWCRALPTLSGRNFRAKFGKKHDFDLRM